MDTRCETWYLLTTLKKSDITLAGSNREAVRTAAENWGQCSKWGSPKGDELCGKQHRG